MRYRTNSPREVQAIQQFAKGRNGRGRMVRKVGYSGSNSGSQGGLQPGNKVVRVVKEKLPSNAPD